MRRWLYRMWMFVKGANDPHPVTWLRVSINRARQFLCAQEWMDLFEQAMDQVPTFTGNLLMSTPITAECVVDDFYVSAAKFMNFRDSEAAPFWGRAVSTNVVQFVPFKCRKCKKSEIRQI